MATVVLYICITLGVLVCLLCIALAAVAVRLSIRLRSLAKSIEQTERQVTERIQYVQLITGGLSLVRGLMARIPRVGQRAVASHKNTSLLKQLMEKIWPKK